MTIPPDLPVDRYERLMLAALALRGQTADDYIGQSSDILYLNALAEAATGAALMRQGAPIAQVREQMAFAALRLLQAGDAYCAERVDGDPDIREVQVDKPTLSQDGEPETDWTAL